MTTKIIVCGKEILAPSTVGENLPHFIHSNNNKRLQIEYEKYSKWFDPINPGLDSHEDCFVHHYELYHSSAEEDCISATELWLNEVKGKPQGVQYEVITDFKIKDTKSVGVLHKSTGFVPEVDFADKSIEYDQNWIMDQYLCLRATTRGNV